MSTTYRQYNLTIVEVTPKRFLAKLISPLFRVGLEKQTREAAANLKKLLEFGVGEHSVRQE